MTAEDIDPLMLMSNLSAVLTLHEDNRAFIGGCTANRRLFTAMGGLISAQSVKRGRSAHSAYR